MTLRVTLGERGGGRSLADLPYTACTFGRRLNDVSDANVSIPVSEVSGADARLLAQVGRWTHEVAVWDENEPASPLWVGPCTAPQWTTQSVTLGARDLFAWFDHRVLPTDRTFHDDDLATIFAAYAADALALDPSPRITVHPGVSGIRGDRQIEGSRFVYAGDMMRELVRSGLDLTVVARNVFLLSPGGPAQRVPALTSDSLDSPTLSPSGADPATDAVVLGTSASSSEQVVGRASLPDWREGLLQAVRSEPAVRDEPSARRAALSDLAASTDAPESLSGTLAPGYAPLADLVPGAVAQAGLRVGVRDVTGFWRLVQVSVSTSPGQGTKTDATFVSLGAGA